MKSDQVAIILSFDELIALANCLNVTTDVVSLDFHSLVGMGIEGEPDDEATSRET